jgi:hypothetical protein
MRKIYLNIKELSLHAAIGLMVALFVSQFSDIRSFRFWYPTIQFALIFYLNYFILFDRFLIRKKYFLFAIINILIVVLFRYDWWIHGLFDSGAHLLKPYVHKQDFSGGNNSGWTNGLSELSALFFPAVISSGIRLYRMRFKPLPAAEKAQEWSAADGKYIFVRSEYKLIKIVLDDVLCFESMKDYVKIWRKNIQKPTLTLMSLKSLEAILRQDKFMRIHRSFIIALGEIHAVERNSVVLSDGKRIVVAEQYKTTFFDFINRNCTE